MFKVIEFMNSKSEQVKKLVRNKKIMAYLENILIILNDKDFSFKNNVEYAWAKFIQDNKMIKKLMKMIFNNPNLAPI